MPDPAWRLAKHWSPEQIRWQQRVEARCLDLRPVEAVLREWPKEADGTPEPAPEDLQDWQPIHMLRVRAMVLTLIKDSIADGAVRLVQFYKMSPHVLSDRETALLARARAERGPSAAERATVLWDPEITLLVFALQFTGSAAVEIQCRLLRECYDRGTLARDIMAEVPTVTTAQAAGTVFHLGVARDNDEMIRDALTTYGVDPGALPPFLGAHSPLCLSVMSDHQPTTRVLLDYYKRRGKLEAVLLEPCCALTDTQAAERGDDPLPIRPPYPLVYHAIEHGALRVYSYLLEAYPELVRPQQCPMYEGRLLSTVDVCALHAWLPGLERELSFVPDEGLVALLSGSEEVLEIVNHRLRPTGETMLHLACRAEKPEGEIESAVGLLLRKGVNPLFGEGLDMRGLLPEDVSRARGHTRVADLLKREAARAAIGIVNYNTKLLKEGKKEKRRWALAIAESVATSAERLRGKKRAPQLKRTGLTVPGAVVHQVVRAAKSGDAEALRECCRRWDAEHPDAPACFRTDAWVPVLWHAGHQAGLGGRMRVLKCLVEEMGVRVHRLSPQEAAIIEGHSQQLQQAQPCHTLLASAVFEDHEEAALYLLRAGKERGDIDPEHDCGNGYNLAYLGATRGVSASLMAALLEEGGFDAGALGEEHVTALGLAASSNHVHLVDCFLAYARRHGLMDEALGSCLDPNGDAPPLVAVVIVAKRLDLLKHLVATVPELDLTRFYYEVGRLDVPALQAARLGNLPMLRFLLSPERDADRGRWPINERTDSAGVTLLHNAVFYDKEAKRTKKRADVLAIVEFLLGLGADPTIEDENGETPIDIARRGGLKDAARRMEEVATKGEREEAVSRLVGRSVGMDRIGS
jgi:ankyrin repeat protein